MSLTRRKLLGGLAASAGGLCVPLSGLSVDRTHHKFIMYFAMGGWDVTKVFWSPRDLINHAPESDAEAGHAHGIDFVDHLRRPQVKSFFTRYGDVSCVINGMLIRSINHRICARLVLTGESAPGAPDWPSIIGADAEAAHPLPSVVVSGPSSPGPLQRYSGMVGTRGQLQSLLDRQIFHLGGEPTSPPGDAVLAEVDALLAERVGRRLAAADHPPEVRVLDTLQDSLERMEQLRAFAGHLSLDTTTARDEIRTAVSLLNEQMARVITLGQQGSPFDNHHEIDAQDILLDGFFGDLIGLIEALRRTPGGGGGSLADETTIVVASEMGRTPWRNDMDGRDHWPFTSCMLIGAGVRGGQSIGGFSELFDGLALDLDTGEASTQGVPLTPAHLGATLLTLAGIDLEKWVGTNPPITAALASP